MSKRQLLPLLLWIGACGPPPEYFEQGVDYRPPTEDGPSSGERGNIKVNELMWSGSVRDDGTYDPDDIYIEFRNEGTLPVNMSQWIIEIDGVEKVSYRIPNIDRVIQTGEEVWLAAKANGCFENATWVLPGFSMPNGDAFRVTLRDADEHLIDSAGARDKHPFVGGYDFVKSRSMERINLMFGSNGGQPHAWHFFHREACSDEVINENPAANEGLQCFEDIPNNTNVRVECRAHTFGSPGLANSADYSGARASGGFE